MDDIYLKSAKTEKLNEIAIEAVTAAVLSSLFILLRLAFSFFILPKLYVKTMPLDVELTKLMRSITKDNRVKVRYVRSKSPNAFNAGTSDVIYTTSLKKLLTKEELVSILCHEWGHFKGKHVIKSGTLNIFGTSVSLFLFQSLLAVLGGMETPVAVTMVSVIAYLFGINVTDLFITLTLSKKWEYYSDSYAVKLGYKKEFISSLKKLEIYVKSKVCKHLSTQQCDLKIEQLHKHSTHPSFKQRIDKLLKQLIPISKFGGIGLLKIYNIFNSLVVTTKETLI